MHLLDVDSFGRVLKDLPAVFALEEKHNYLTWSLEIDWLKHHIATPLLQEQLILVLIHVLKEVVLDFDTPFQEHLNLLPNQLILELLHVQKEVVKALVLLVVLQNEKERIQRNDSCAE